MLLNTTFDPHDSSCCQLTYEEPNGWLRATWRGFVDPLEAQRGAAAYLHYAAQTPSALLLNDNSQLRGPWFDSFEWLKQVWVPQATSLGLRWVAHVVQADRHADLLTSQLFLNLPFELQIFQELADAQHWLHQQAKTLNALN
ncbi:MAG: hypothetical protein EOO62_01035 [Hymenobacter sp.]|nr:MAG: hypothetical protein EOO62_01035 [Hymenobacter sp.]